MEGFHCIATNVGVLILGCPYRGVPLYCKVPLWRGSTVLQQLRQHLAILSIDGWMPF